MKTKSKRKLLRTLKMKCTGNSLEFPEKVLGEPIRIGNEVLINGIKNHTGKYTTSEGTELQIINGTVCRMVSKDGKVTR
ncbi:hypothetical protein [Ulvibacter sp. MAR_2010_11]|uniref:hypothetical protein n=1 Tax=Ulvibacter sp. MAR_2010_11 TaxID=1250229 RepID=UPI000C2BE348|nr:hypothetical protein [Ulvibacter sp. MAR_2010_11]